MGETEDGEIGELLGHQFSSESPPVADGNYQDGGAAGTYLALRESEKSLARRLAAVEHLDGLNGHRDDAIELMRRWHDYSRMLGGEHFGPYHNFGQQRVLLYGDALAGNLPSGGLRGLASIIAPGARDDPSSAPALEGDALARYKRYSATLY